MPDAQNVLAQLRDIHLPTEVLAWPWAIGWWVLLALAFALLYGVTHAVLRHHKRTRPRRMGLKLLQLYEQQYRTDNDATLACAQVSKLLRRVALVYFPRDKVAALRGEEWLLFLDATGKHTHFASLEPLLLWAPFQRECTLSPDPLFAQARLWIKQRRLACFK